MNVEDVTCDNGVHTSEEFLWLRQSSRNIVFVRKSMDTSLNINHVRLLEV